MGTRPATRPKLQKFKHKRESAAAHSRHSVLASRKGLAGTRRTGARHAHTHTYTSTHTYRPAMAHSPRLGVPSILRYIHAPIHPNRRGLLLVLARCPHAPPRTRKVRVTGDETAAECARGHVLHAPTDKLMILAVPWYSGLSLARHLPPADTAGDGKRKLMRRTALRPVSLEEGAQGMPAARFRGYFQRRARARDLRRRHGGRLLPERRPP